MHKASPKYRYAPRKPARSHHRAGKRERAEQNRHRRMILSTPNGELAYPCEVPDCTSVVPVRERDSWQLPVGHMGPVANKRWYPGAPEHIRPILWIPFVKKVSGCGDCWIQLNARRNDLSLKPAEREFLPDGYKPPVKDTDKDSVERAKRSRQRR